MKEEDECIASINTELKNLYNGVDLVGNIKVRLDKFRRRRMLKRIFVEQAGRGRLRGRR